jgi:hypothetical protein
MAAARPRQEAADEVIVVGAHDHLGGDFGSTPRQRRRPTAPTTMLPVATMLEVAQARAEPT